MYEPQPDEKQRAQPYVQAKHLPREPAECDRQQSRGRNDPVQELPAMEMMKVVPFHQVGCGRVCH